MGSGISGAGPTIFALSKGEETSENVMKRMQNVYDGKGIPFEIFNSKINTSGVQII